MRGFFILILICLLIIPSPVDAFIFHKKDYKQIFLQQALNAEKRNNDKAAFHSYEKALFYYKKDITVIESYAKFCERKQYFEKAEELYQKLFILTKDKKYLFKKNLSGIKNGRLSGGELSKLTKTKGLTSSQRNALNEALIFHFSNKQNWNEVKNTCAKIPKNAISRDIITTCIVATEKTSDKKSSLGYYLRFSQLYPKDSQVVNKIISLEEYFKNYTMQEEFIKKLSAQNPKDKGIKYKLAGLYEKHQDWKKAAKVYQNLMASGDRSKHVKDSYAYVLTQLNPKKPVKYETETYIPKPLSGYKLYEKLFYEAWHEKNYDEALNYLEKMLDSQPKNPKLLKHKVDILMSQNNYKDSLAALENLQKIKPLSTKDEKLLAFLYSKSENYSKAIEIIENQLMKHPDDKELLNLALEYSMAEKYWDKAIIYTNKLLIFKPKSEKLLKNAGDLYSIKKDFSNAISYYEKLVEYYPKQEYKTALANFYMANQEFENAQTILEPLYNENPDNKEITDAYLNSLLAQQKTMKAYFVIKDRNLENTKEGYTILGDLDLKHRHYDSAGHYFFKALQLDPDNLTLKNKLAQAYRSLGHIATAGKLYCEVLNTDPNNLQAKLGLGYLEIDKKNFKKSRKVFCQILAEQPNYRPAKLGIIHSYIANGDDLKALELLKKMPADADIKLMKAQIYYKIGMLSDALQNVPGKHECEICEAKKTIKKRTRTKKITSKSAKFEPSTEENLAENKGALNTEKSEITPYKPEFNTSSEPSGNKAENSIEKPEVTAGETGSEGLKITPESEGNKTDFTTELFVTPSSNEANLYVIPGLPEHVQIVAPGSTKLIRAGIYENAQDFLNQIKKAQAFTIIPSYSLLSQQLEDEFDLDYKQFGLFLSKNTEANSNVFMQYNVIVYTSGARTGLTNVTHEFYGGVQSRPVEKWEYRADMGVKIFEFDEGSMITSDSWIKHYFNDNFNLKLGYRRNNIEQSFLAAVGEPVNGVFTGRAADNKFYLEFNGKLPHGFYTFGRGSYGVIYAQNLVTNQYSEGMIGAGKLLYNNPKNKWINTFGIDVISYNSSYQYNLLNIYDNTGRLFGGYFSPSYYNTETANLKLEGSIQKLHLKYGVKGFGGIQTAVSQDTTTPTWGVASYISYELNDHLAVNASYSFYNYASVQRNLFMVSLVIRGFRKNAKS